MSDHVLRNDDSEILISSFKFTVNSGRTPSRVVPAHGADQVANFFWNTWTSRLAMPDFPGPIPLEALPMPSDDGSGFDD